MCHSGDPYPGRCRWLTRSLQEGTRPVPMLAELVDAVVGVDTHRDTHQVEIALSNGAPIACTTISNDTSGFAELLAWIVDHAPGRGWRCPSRAPAATASDWPAPRLDADRLPTPRADGDREALRILLSARQELTTASTAQTNRLRALLLG